jgi:hypothetical protein
LRRIPRQAHRLQSRRDLGVDGEAGHLAVALLEHVGERDVELAGVFLLGDLEAAEHDPAAVASGAKAFRLEAIPLEEILDVRAPPLVATQPLVRLVVEEDRFHSDLKIRVQESLKSFPATVEFIVYAPNRVQRRAGIGLLHRRVELTLERLDVVLVVHLMVSSISPVVRIRLGGACGKLSEPSWRERPA